MRYLLLLPLILAACEMSSGDCLDCSMAPPAAEAPPAGEIPEPRPTDIVPPEGEVTATPIAAEVAGVSAAIGDEAEAKPAEAAPDATPKAAGEPGTTGRTVASLGDPTKKGLWLSTSLVTKPSKGKIALASGGALVEVDLIPGPEGGARLSLEGYRALSLDLKDLPELIVTITS